MCSLYTLHREHIPYVTDLYLVCIHRVRVYCVATPFRVVLFTGAGVTVSNVVEYQNRCTCMYTLSPTHIRIHARAHTGTHAHTHMHAHTHTDTDTQMCAHTCTHAHTHTRTQTHKIIRTHTHAHEPLLIHAHVHACIYMHIHAYG